MIGTGGQPLCTPGSYASPGVICIFNKGYFKKVAYEKLCANDYGLEKIANFAP